jgi:hypothetical protein
MYWLGEPTLADVLSDPIIIALMDRDNVKPDDLMLFLNDVRRSIDREALAFGSCFRASCVWLREQVIG